MDRQQTWSIEEEPINIDCMYNLDPTDKLQYHIKLYLEHFAALPNFVTERLGALLDTHGWRNKRLALAAALQKEVDRLRNAPDTARDWGMRAEKR